MAELHQFTNSAVPLARHEADAIAELLADIHRQTGGLLVLLTERMNQVDGDPDDEPNGDDEPVSAEGDSGDAAFVEWVTKPGNLRRHGGPEITGGHEDDEDGDQDTCAAADDQGGAGGRWFDTDGLPGDSEDAEDGGDTELNGDEGDYGGEVDGV